MTEHAFTSTAGGTNLADADRSDVVSGTRRWLDTALLTLVAAASYVLFQQAAIHYIDANAMVRALVLPDYIAGYGHFGYRALIEALYAVSDHDEPFYDNLLWLSAIAAALAAGAGHRACILCGLDRWRAILATLAAASTVSWVHFATVVEIHAVFLLPVSCAWWALARFVQRPCLATITPVGVATGVATAIHYSGVLLPLLGLLCFLAVRLAGRIGWSRAILCWCWWSAVHAGLFWGLHELVLQYSGTVSDHATVGFVKDRFDNLNDWVAIMAMARYEWFQPFAPWSLGFLVAWYRPGWRLAVIAMSFAWLGFLAVDYVVLGLGNECGAYALPMAVPAAALCAATWRVRWMVLGVAVSLGMSTSNYLHQNAARTPSPAFGQALHAFCRDNPDYVLVLGGYAELDSVLVHAPPTPHYSIFEFEFVKWVQPGIADETVRSEVIERVQRATADGGCFVWSAEALAAFELLPRNRSLLVELGNSFEMARIEQGAFRGLVLRSRR